MTGTKEMGEFRIQVQVEAGAQMAKRRNTFMSNLSFLNGVTKSLCVFPTT